MASAYEVYQEKMTKTLSVLKEELNTVRAGRANAALLDQVTVDYYGVPTPLKNLANIQVPDPRSLTIIPLDPKSLKNIEKAIQISNLGINPTNDGKLIRLVFPELTEERRRELVKTIKKKAEEAKVAIRAIRRDANESLKKQKKDSEITEDDQKLLEEEAQEITDKAIKEIDRIASEKEKEIMEF